MVQSGPTVFPFPSPTCPYWYTWKLSEIGTFLIGCLSILYGRLCAPRAPCATASPAASQVLPLLLQITLQILPGSTCILQASERARLSGHPLLSLQPLLRNQTHLRSTTSSPSREFGGMNLQCGQHPVKQLYAASPRTLLLTTHPPPARRYLLSVRSLIQTSKFPQATTSPPLLPAKSSPVSQC
jgi:hypothetical protein